MSENSDPEDLEEITLSQISKPVGSIYRLSTQTVSQMTDPELLNHIKKLKEELREAERQADQKRVCLTMATSQLEVSREKERRRLRNIRVSPTSIKIAVSPKLSVKDNLGVMFRKLRDVGKSEDEILGIIKQLQQIVEQSNKETISGKQSSEFRQKTT